MIATRRRTAAPPVQALELPADPQSAGRARRFVADALHAWALDDFVDDTALLTSEIVTNAVLHAGSGRIRMRLRLVTGGVRIEVDDRSALVPRPRRVSQLSDTGRGMELVELSARAWGTEPTGQGKTVWFEIATT